MRRTQRPPVRLPRWRPRAPAAAPLPSATAAAPSLPSATAPRAPALRATGSAAAVAGPPEAPFFPVVMNDRAPVDRDPVPAFAELPLYENLIDFGFTADGKHFVTCHGWRYAPPLRRECYVDGPGSAALSSKQTFDDGHSPRKDTEVNAKLAKLGYPAPPGKWPYPDVVITWRHDREHDGFSDTIVFAARELSTHAETRLNDVPAEGPGDHV